MNSARTRYPRTGGPAGGLYDASHEHDSCGVGFVADMKGRKSHGIIRQALTILANLEHRGACGCEENTGDGAGILIQMPDAFLRPTCAALGFELPAVGYYGAGLVFLPRNTADAEFCVAQFERVIEEEGQQLLGWREVPSDNSMIGPTARSGEPAFRQLFIARSSDIATAEAFERKLYVIRKRVEHAVWDSGIEEKALFYVTSLSYRTFIYKGMLNADQVAKVFPDLCDQRMDSALALVHQRFSTNTFPSWPLQASGIIIKTANGSGRPAMCRNSSTWSKLAESELPSNTIGKSFCRSSPKRSELHSASRARIQLMLPRKVLISPL